jgi:chromosome segregation ATPase
MLTTLGQGFGAAV